MPVSLKITECNAQACFSQRWDGRRRLRDRGEDWQPTLPKENGWTASLLCSGRRAAATIALRQLVEPDHGQVHHRLRWLGFGSTPALYCWSRGRRRAAATWSCGTSGRPEGLRKRRRRRPPKENNARTESEHGEAPSICVKAEDFVLRL